MPRLPQPVDQPAFAVRVDVGSFASAAGTGRTKRQAEQDAAAAFMEREGIAQDDG